jgi:4-amino-4-deoxy-L-arabinose transferase-like glycosyltransferase
VRAGKPSVWGMFAGWRPGFGWVRGERILFVLAAGVLVSYVFGFAQILFIPQNNMDSLSTHLTRIVFWRQHGSLAPWSTPQINQMWYPINAQLQTYWTLLFLGSDRLVGSVQWLAALAAGLGVYGVARQLDFERRPSAFAGLIFLTYPLVALQSTTTQTDLVTAGYFMAAVYFLLAGVRDERSALLLLSGVSIGLGLGVKKSFFILLPVLAVIALLLLIQSGRRGWKPLLTWGVYALLGISIFGAYMYVLSWRTLGDPFGSPEYIDDMLDVPQTWVQPAKVWLNPIAQTQLPTDSRLLEIAYNAPRLFYQALDTSGVPRPLDGYAHKAKLRVVRPFFQLIGFAEIESAAYTAPNHPFSFADKNINEESHAWYGPLSFLLVLPALLVAAWRGLRERQPLLLMPLLGLLVFLPLEIIFRPGWDPFQGRYFAPLAALCATLIALWFPVNSNKVWAWLIAGLAVVIVVNTFLTNPSKPTAGKYADEFRVWTNPDRVFLQTIQAKQDRWVYFIVERSVPQDATLGYYIPFYFMEYPLFGADLTRRLVPMNTPAQVTDLDWQKGYDVDYLLLPDAPDMPLPPDVYEIVDGIPGWTLYTLKLTP